MDQVRRDVHLSRKSTSEQARIDVASFPDCMTLEIWNR